MNVSSMFGLNLLVCMICLMVLCSFSLSLSSSAYVVSLVVKYVTAAVFCSRGWFESLGMMIAVAVRFRYTLHENFF
jgi:multisubunit Na+/H+ antiporter MnhE subunit